MAESGVCIAGSGILAVRSWGTYSRIRNTCNAEIVKYSHKQSYMYVK